MFTSDFNGKEILDALPQPNLILTADGAVLHMNAAAASRLGTMADQDNALIRLSAAGYEDDQIAAALRAGTGATEAWTVSTLANGARLLNLNLSGAELRQRNRLMRVGDVFDALSDGILVLDEFAHVALTNKTMRDQLGAVGMDLKIGMAYHETVRFRLDLEGLIPEAQREEAAKQMAGMMLRKCREGGQTRIDLAGNIVEVYHSMVGDHFLLVYHDATARETQARALRHAMERYRRVIEDQTEMICRFDRDFILTFANPPYRKAFSHDGRDLVGVPFTDLIPADEAREAIVAGISALTPENPILQDTYFEPDEEGNPRWMTWSNRALFDDHGALVEYQAVGRDVTAERLAQDALDRQNATLAQSEKMAAMGSLLASVSHELNNPLSIVLGQSEILETVAQDEATLQRAGRIKAAAERCGRIVRTFLAMARQREMERSPVNLAQTVEIARSMAAYAFSASGIELKVNLPSQDLYVLGDGDQLVQVFVNMLLNAQQAMEGWPDARNVWIEGFVANGRATLEVHDSGPGVPDDLVEQIFEPFFTTKGEGDGTGIGLSLCRNIVESHGGTLTLRNREKGGAVFAISLPMAEVEETLEPADIADQWQHLPALNILLVDDEPEVAQVSADILSADGHQIHLVGDGQDALDALRTMDFDVVLSDIRMPGLDGPGLWKALEDSGIFPVERVGFLTGDTLSITVQNFLEQNPTEVLNKPFHRDELHHLILKLLSVEI